ncbi:MAG TPA: hypothetical protein VJK90_11925, partial [Acetobacteraceae bacterium]|nr:hypothetical protein [Acetobacteraceae bacterium]
MPLGYHAEQIERARRVAVGEPRERQGKRYVLITRDEAVRAVEPRERFLGRCGCFGAAPGISCLTAFVV